MEVQSNTKKGRSGKLSYHRRGPYKIIKILQGGSYLLQKFNSPPSSQTIKKHSNHIYRCPPEIIPHRPTDSSDTCFSTLDKSIQQSLYHQAGIKNYQPAKPFLTAAAAHSKIDLLLSTTCYQNNVHTGIMDIEPSFPTV